MVSLSTSTLPSSLPNDWCQLVQGLFLATLGVLLLSAGMQEQTLSAIPADSLPGHRNAREARTTLIAPPVPTQGRAMRAWGQVWVGTEEVVFANQGKPRRPADCLGADLATGQRAESAHLATIPLQRPGECGDLRDVLLMMAIRHPGSHGNRWCVPCPRNGAPPYPADIIDLVSAALFGPPDRQPAAMLAAEFLGHERGDARRYLERTATGKWLELSFRRIMDWNETSGYGSVETHRVGR